MGGKKLSSVGRRIGKTLVAVLAMSALVASLAGAARAAETSFNRSRTILFNGEPTFPLVLSPGPPLNGSTPWGTNGLAETAAAGVNVYRTGAGGPWTPAAIQSGIDWNRAAAALHVYTWPNLGGYSVATPGSSDDEGLAAGGRRAHERPEQQRDRLLERQ